MLVCQRVKALKSSLIIAMRSELWVCACQKKRFDFHEPIATCQEYVKFLYHHAAAEETTSFRHL